VVRREQNENLTRPKTKLNLAHAARTHRVFQEHGSHVHGDGGNACFLQHRVCLYRGRVRINRYNTPLPNRSTDC